jgi:ABC-type nickel/cobalt efflux system permease component RcnA
LNLRRILNLAAAFAAVATAAAVCVVAASFALYALARIYLGAAGAAAVVAGVFALIAVVVAWLATRKVAPKRKPAAPSDQSTIDRLIDMAKERPLIALGATAAAVTILIRNPAVVGAIVSAFVAGGASKPDK